MKRLLMLVVLMHLTAVPSYAGPGHDHGDETPVASGNGPARQPDGSVFLPKPAQRQMGVRTLPVARGALPRALELQGKVIMDPNAGGRVQPMQAGRIEPGPRGLPLPGQTVRKGEVLAFVIPSAGVLERASQQAQIGELSAAHALAQKRLVRLKDLADTIPRKEIEAVESEIESLAARMRALSGGLATRETLVAPVTGVIASTTVVAGQVVDARELLFEVVDPSRMRIEALTYDAGVANDIGAASIAIGNERTPLEFIGAARSLREQALPLSFRVSGAAVSRLAIGQPVQVHIETRAKVEGIRLPRSALQRNPSNQTIVWIKQAPERFEPRIVTFEPLDGASVAVTSGLAASDRVVVEGAPLINQIR